jgi:hypothetical protein
LRRARSRGASALEGIAMETKSSDRISDPSPEAERTSDRPESAAHPGVGRARKGRRADRDDLEQRLAAIAEDVRVQSEQAERQRREQTPPEARVHLEGVKPIASHPPDKIEGAKIVLASGLDPRQDATLVGRRNGHEAWEFGTVGDTEAVDLARGGASKAAGGGRRRRRILLATLGSVAAPVLLLLILHARLGPEEEPPARPAALLSMPEGGEARVAPAPAAIAPAAPGSAEKESAGQAQDDAGIEGRAGATPQSRGVAKGAPSTPTTLVQGRGVKAEAARGGKRRGPVGKNPEY